MRSASLASGALLRSDHDSQKLVSFFQKSDKFVIFTRGQFSKAFKPEQGFICFFFNCPKFAEEVSF